MEQKKQKIRHVLEEGLSLWYHIGRLASIPPLKKCKDRVLDYMNHFSRETAIDPHAIVCHDVDEEQDV
jgi:hypothetical protein